MVQVSGRLLQAVGQDRGQLESEWGGVAEEFSNLAGTDDYELRLLGGPDCAGPELAQESGHLPQVAPRLGNDGNPFFVDQDFRLPVQEDVHLPARISLLEEGCPGREVPF